MENKYTHHKTIQIKNMVCPRCIKVVRDELENLGITVVSVELGSAILEHEGSINEEALEAALVRNGFVLLRSKRKEIAEKVKTAVIALIYDEKLSTLKTTVSTYLAEELGKDYSTISTAFKDSEDITLSRYVVLQKIARAKELLTYNELSFSDIAEKLGYRSLQHLSGQFKEVTGITLSKYKNQDSIDRQSIDNLY